MVGCRASLLLYAHDSQNGSSVLRDGELWHPASFGPVFGRPDDKYRLDSQSFEKFRIAIRGYADDLTFKQIVLRGKS